MVSRREMMSHAEEAEMGRCSRFRCRETIVTTRVRIRDDGTIDSSKPFTTTVRARHVRKVAVAHAIGERRGDRHHSVPAGRVAYSRLTSENR